MMTPEIREAFLAVIQDIVDNAIIVDMIDAIERGDIEAAFRAVGFSEAALRPLTAAIERAFELGGIYTGDTFPKYLNTPSGRAIFRFDPRNSRAEAWLRDHSSTLVQRLKGEALTNMRETLTEAMAAGRNPRSTALDIAGRIDPKTGHRVGGIVGLTENQMRWVANTRRDLENLDDNYFTRALRDKRFDRTVEKAIREGKPLDAETINKLVLRYKDNTLKYRAESIARTESIQSLNRAEYEAHKQAVDMGAVNQGAMKRVWDSAGDSRVRWSHRKLDGQTVGIDEPFISPSGAKMMFPGDTSLGAPADEVVMCRCRVRLKVDWLADVDDDPIPSPKLTVATQNNMNDQRMRDQVVSQGIADGREHLRVYNSKTGEEIDARPVNQTAKSITFNDDLVSLLNDRNNALVLHHNHPNSNSFSKQDLNVLNRPGAKGIWAHGHDGTSYYAEKGTVQFKMSDFERIENEARKHVQSAVNNRVMSPEDANALFYHLVSEKISDKSMIKYETTLSDRLKEILQRNATFIKLIKDAIK